ncbi:unnamed protein product [Durusdinium trenchii]|uniref:Uncharacterized protein n=1 Tax=Durusdinium trenchii TaxID=1381693 RepID=A0ABP0RRM4_9DINO
MIRLLLIFIHLANGAEAPKEEENTSRMMRRNEELRPMQEITIFRVDADAETEEIATLNAEVLTLRRTKEHLQHLLRTHRKPREHRAAQRQLMPGRQGEDQKKNIAAKPKRRGSRERKAMRG